MIGKLVAAALLALVAAPAIAICGIGPAGLKAPAFGGDLRGSAVVGIRPLFPTGLI